MPCIGAQKHRTMTDEELRQGKIYFISYGGVEILGRFDAKNTTDLAFYDYLHYWNGYEKFYKNARTIVRSGIIEIRPATVPEKMALIRFEIENDCI